MDDLTKNSDVARDPIFHQEINIKEEAWDEVLPEVKGECFDEETLAAVKNPPEEDISDFNVEEPDNVESEPEPHDIEPGPEPKDITPGLEPDNIEAGAAITTPGHESYNIERGLEHFEPYSTDPERPTMDSNGEGKPYACETCDFRCQKYYHLESHSKTHEGGSHACDYCEYTTTFRGQHTQHFMVHLGPRVDLVCLLLETPFRRWKEEERSFILENQPTPSINRQVPDRRQGKSFARSFQDTWYKSTPWLCGSFYKESLFCWPCLLLSQNKSVWNTTGFIDLKNMSRSIKIHGSSKEHLSSAWALKKLEANRLSVLEQMEVTSQLMKTKYNEKVRLNRLILSKIINVVLFLTKGELPFRGYDEKETSLFKGNYVELLNLIMSEASPDLQSHYASVKNIFTGPSKTIQNEIIQCAADHVKDLVYKQIHSAKFFSVQVDDTTDITQKSQCSIIVRFVNDSGVPTERFLGFHDVSENHNAQAFFELLDSILAPFSYGTRLVAQCYDGASVMSGRMNGLQAKISSVAPLAFFIHCLAHRLNLVLQYSCQINEICRRYFSTLTGIPSFFHHSAKRTRILSTVLNRSVPQVGATRWNSRSRILSLIVNNWEKMKEVFDMIMSDHECSTDYHAAEGFRAKFENFEFYFLSLIFDDIFNLTNDLFKFLQEKSLDINSCITKIDFVRDKISQKRSDEKFEKFFNNALSQTKFPQPRGLNEDQVKQKYKSLYFEIIDIITTQLGSRFADLQKLDFLKLADPTRFKEYDKKFPSNAFDEFIKTHGIFFDDSLKLKNELKIVYGDETLQFEPIEMLQYLQSNRNFEVLSEVYTFYCLVVTIPSTSASAERSFSCLKRIKSYLRSTMNQDRLNSLAILSIEKDILLELKDKQELHDPIIDKFARLKDRKLNLIYKT